MKNCKLSKLTFIPILLLFLATFIFVGDFFYKQESVAYEIADIEYHDDYVDYIRANPDGINKYIPAVYDLFINNIDEIKTGAFSLSLSTLEEIFDDLTSLSQDNLLKVLLGAMDSLKFDNPELFFIDFTKINIKTAISSSTNDVVDIILDSENCFIDEITSQNQLNTMIEDMREEKEYVYSQIDSNWTDYEIVGFVNDYIVRSVDYDTSLQGNIIHTAYGALVNNLAVCDGYSYAVQYLLDGLGIDNYVAAGRSLNNSTGSWEGHMWSYVEIYGHWYGLDTTWNDPIFTFPSEDLTNKYIRSYFLMGGDEDASTGFYEERSLNNYHLYIPSSNLYYGFPVPTIENESFVNPELEEIILTTEKFGTINTKITVQLNASNLMDDMSFAYALSTDGGITYGDKIPCSSEIVFDNSNQNGIYKFYIISSDGKIVDERIYLNDNTNQKCEIDIGEVYTLSINSNIQNLIYEINPEKSAYFTGDNVQISFIEIPEGYEIECVSSEQVSLQKNSAGNYEFTFNNTNVEIDVLLKAKEYNLSILKDDGVVLQLNKEKATFGETVELKILSLPEGKKIQSINGVEFVNGETEFVLNEVYQFVMPSNDVEIEIVLEDEQYSISVIEIEGVAIQLSKQKAIFEEIVELKILSLPEGKKIQSINGVEFVNGETEFVLNKVYQFIMPSNDVEIEIVLENIIYQIDIVADESLNFVISKENAIFGEEISIKIDDLEEYQILIVDFNIEIEYEQTKNNEIIFTMPSSNVEVTLSIDVIPALQIVVEYNREIDFQLSQQQAYFGEEIILTILNLPKDYYIQSVVLNDSIKLNELEENIYSFTMPNEIANIFINVFVVPKIDLHCGNYTYSEGIIEEDGEFFYLIKLNNLPSNKYVKQINVSNGDNILYDCVYKVNDNTFKIKLNDEDVDISFVFAEKIKEDTSGSYQMQNLILIIVIVIVVICVVAMIGSFAFRSKW